jgi:hypothetical protein
MNQINQMNKTNQINLPTKIHATAPIRFDKEISGSPRELRWLGLGLEMQAEGIQAEVFGPPAFSLNP